MSADVDLFAGAGGWDVAAERLDLHPEGVELDATAAATGVAAGFKRLVMDVRDYHPEAGLRGEIASPPCPTFSPAGKGQGRVVLPQLVEAVHIVGDGYPVAHALGVAGIPDVDIRSALVLEPLRVAVEGRPEWVALEQVSTVLPVWEAYAEVLRNRGYSVATGVLNAEQYGVPQTRRRAILVASLSHEAFLPAPTHSRYYSRSPERLDSGVLPWVSMADALSWGLTDRPAPTVTGGGTETCGAEPIAHLSRYVGRSAWIPRPAAPGDTSWVYRRPSPTIVGTFAPDVVAAPGYRKPGDPPRQKTPGSVRVTVQEAAILQSFPPDHPWQGRLGQQYLQVGNAIPPLLAGAVLRSAM